MSRMNQFSDATLRAYLEGRSDAATARQIEAAVGADAGLEQRVMALDPVAGTVRAAFEDVPDPARLSRLQQAPAAAPAAAGPRVGARSLAGVAAGLVLAAGLGFGLGRVGGGPDPVTWTEQVANYQSLYVPETVASIEVTEPGLEAQFARAEAALGRPLPRAALAELDGLDLRRAQVLAFEGRPLVQVAFAGAGGVPVAFCILRLDGAADDATAQPHMERLVGLEAAHWTRDGYGYLLIGGSDPEAVRAASEALARVF